MIDISEQGKSLYKKGKGIRILTASFHNAGIELQNEDIVEDSLEIEESLCSGKEFKFGCAEASMCKFDFFSRDDIGNVVGDTITVNHYIQKNNISLTYPLSGQYGINTECIEDMIKRILVNNGIDEKGYNSTVAGLSYVPDTASYCNFSSFIWMNIKEQKLTRLPWCSNYSDDMIEYYINQGKYNVFHLEITQQNIGGYFYLELEIEVTEVNDERLHDGDNVKIAICQCNSDLGEDIELFYTECKIGVRKIIQHVIKLDNNASSILRIRPYNYDKGYFYNANFVLRKSEYNPMYETGVYIKTKCNLYETDQIPLGIFTIQSCPQILNDFTRKLTAYDNLYSEKLDKSITISGGNMSSIGDVMKLAENTLGISFGGSEYCVDKNYDIGMLLSNADTRIYQTEYPGGLVETVTVYDSEVSIKQYSQLKYKVNTYSNYDNESALMRVIELEKKYGIISHLNSYFEGNDEEYSWYEKYYAENGCGYVRNENFYLPGTISSGRFYIPAVNSIEFVRKIRNELANNVTDQIYMGYKAQNLIKKPVLTATGSQYGLYTTDTTEIIQDFLNNKKVKITVQNAYMRINKLTGSESIGSTASLAIEIYSDAFTKIKSGVLSLLQKGKIYKYYQTNTGIVDFYGADNETYETLIKSIQSAVTTASFTITATKKSYGWEYENNTISWILSAEVYTEAEEGEIYILQTNEKTNIKSIKEYHNTEQLLELSISGSSSVQTTLRKVVASYYELNGLFFIIGRDGNPRTIVPHDIALYPSELLYPRDSLYPGEVSLQASGELVRELSIYRDKIPIMFCGIEIYKNGVYMRKYDVMEYDNDFYEEHKYNDWNDREPYCIEDNFFFDNFTFSSDNLQTILSELWNKIKGIEIRNIELKMIGLPYVEVGDSLSVFGDKDAADLIVLNRSLKGIQAIEDSVVEKYE